MSPNKNPKFSKAMNFTVAHPTIRFRILCSISAAGGIIGHSGTIVKRLERETCAKIKVDDAVSSSCKERLVHVIGCPTINRKLWLSDEEELEVSAAQEGLVRIFDRILELEPPKKVGGEVMCRLLVGPRLVGAVMGEGVGRILEICQETGGFVKVFKSPESLPPCANSSDELIQIRGGSQAVRKALIAVSQYIQEKTLRITGAKVASAVLRPSPKMETVDAATSNRVNEGVVAEVVFRMLCPYDLAGFVIGHRGRKVKALEEETEASIQFSAPDNGHNERIITVSAFENRKTNHSSAQNAIVRVFNELTSSGKTENVTARLLILPSQLVCLDVHRDSIIACISKTTGATLQFLEHKYAHGDVSTDEEVIQIDGEYPSVQIALFQVTWMLRECIFGALLAKNNLPLLPHKLFNLPHYLREIAALTENMKTCRVTDEVSCSLPFNVQLSEFSSEPCLLTSVEHPRDSTTDNGVLEHGSGSKSVIKTNSKLEITLRADVFSSIFGDDGINLSRLRTVSGAKVELQAPSVGGDGQVIISGTPDQTLAGQCLLQACIISAL